MTTEEVGRTIHFLAIIPLLPQELEFARKQESEAQEILNERRRSQNSFHADRAPCRYDSSLPLARIG